MWRDQNKAMKRDRNGEIVKSTVHIKEAAGWPGAQGSAAHFLLQGTSGGPFRAHRLGRSEIAYSESL